MIYNVVLVSGVQQSESVIHIHISTLFQILLDKGFVSLLILNNFHLGKEETQGKFILEKE